MYMKDWVLAVFIPIKFVSLGIEEERWKEKIKLYVVFLFCVYLQTSCKSMREKIPSCQQFLVSTTAKTKQCYLKAVFKIGGTGIYLVVGFEPKICLPNNLWPVVHHTFITLG